MMPRFCRMYYIYRGYGYGALIAAHLAWRRTRA